MSPLTSLIKQQCYRVRYDDGQSTRVFLSFFFFKSWENGGMSVSPSCSLLSLTKRIRRLLAAVNKQDLVPFACMTLDKVAPDPEPEKWGMTDPYSAAY